MTPEARKRLKPASERKRRMRARQRRGEIVAPMVVPMKVVRVLMELGWLPVERSEDRAAIGDAAKRLLMDLANNVQN